jgi:putative inorganic carbon (hco3(-)) transporter
MKMLNMSYSYSMNWWRAMRDYLIFAIVFGLLPFVLNRPVLGILLFTWISLMNPHRLTYGAAYDFPFAAIIAIITIIGLFISRQPRRFPFTPVTVLLMIFMAWMTLSSFFALEPNLVWAEWNRVMKTLFITLLAIYALNTERDIKAFAWVIGLSLAFYGLKGGVFTLVSGGSSHVYGPAGSYIGDNNAIALALITALPIIWYLKLHAGRKWLRTVLAGLAVLTVIAAAGSYSRGAMIAGAAMLFFLWLKSTHKLSVGVVLILVVPLLFTVMPEKWFNRMDTIDNYKEDASALGRINAWHFAANVAQDNVLGGGYSVFTNRMFYIYAPEPNDHHAAHSIYFQVLGEHGFIGLGLFLALMLFAWRTGSRIVKYCQEKPELKWASDLAAMSQVSMIGFAVGGAFLTLAYYDLYYDIIALLVVLEKIVLQKSTLPAIQPLATSFSAAKQPGYQGKRS